MQAACTAVGTSCCEYIASNACSSAYEVLYLKCTQHVQQCARRRHTTFSYCRTAAFATVAAAVACACAPLCQATRKWCRQAPSRPPGAPAPRQPGYSVTERLALTSATAKPAQLRYCSMPGDEGTRPVVGCSVGTQRQGSVCSSICMSHWLPQVHWLQHASLAWCVLPARQQCW
jgi:hypothetical protein